MDSESVVRLRAVIARLDRQLNATYTGEGLTPTQASVLALVAFRGPLGLAELNEMEGLNPTMLSRIVAHLAKAGYIHRQKDPTDLRAARLEITPEGLEVHVRIRTQRTQAVSECLARLPEDTVGTLLAALDSLEALANGLKVASARQNG